MTRQERAYRLVFQDSTISRAMTRDEAMNEFRYPSVAEVVHVTHRKPQGCPSCHIIIGHVEGCGYK